MRGAGNGNAGFAEDGEGQGGCFVLGEVCWGLVRLRWLLGMEAPCCEGWDGAAGSLSGFRSCVRSRIAVLSKGVLRDAVLPYRNPSISGCAFGNMMWPWPGAEVIEM